MPLNIQNIIPPCEQDSSKFASSAFNISVHVAILLLILSLFFMFYVSKISSAAINKEVGDDINKFLGPVIQKQVGSNPYVANLINKIPFDKVQTFYSGPDFVSTLNNSWLFKLIIFINVAIILAIIYTVFLLRNACGICIPVKDILITNAVIFFFIGIVEYLFFTHIAVKFIPVKPSVIINAFIDDTKNVLSPQ